MAGVLPPGLTQGNRLGEPFDSERVYVQERDPKLLRAVGVPLTEDAYALMDHCDQAGTGNQNSRTEAVEITAQWQGKERLPAALRTLLAQLPEHYAFDNTELVTGYVPTTEEIEEQVAAIPGSFQNQDEPRLYLGKADGVTVPRSLKEAMELMLLVIDPNDERQPKYLERSEVHQFLDDAEGLKYYRPQQIEKFRKIGEALDAQIAAQPETTRLPSLDVPHLGNVELPLLEIPLPRNRRIALTVQLDYELELERTALDGSLAYKRSGFVQIDVPAGLKAIIRDPAGERALDEGKHRAFEGTNGGQATIEIFDRGGKKIADRCFEVPELDFSIDLDRYATLPVAHDGKPVQPKLTEIDEAADPPFGRWKYGAEVRENARKVARAAELFALPESKVANGRYRIETYAGGRSATVDLEKYSDSLYRVAVNDSEPKWLVPSSPPNGAEAEGVWFVADDLGGFTIGFKPETGELLSSWYGRQAVTDEVTSAQIEREQRITDPDGVKYAFVSRMTCLVGSADDSDWNAVHPELSQLDVELISALRRNGVELSVCRDAITEYHPELAGQQPRGAPAFATYDGMDGFYDPESKEITVATTGNGYARTLRQGAALEQIGRAIDDVGGDLSKSAAFRKAYRAELENLKQQDLAFLIQPGDDGPEQAFAASFAWSVHDRAKLEQFPALRDYWDDRTALKAILEERG